ncbi:MAG: Ku protein [Haloplasmataceae bacterium]|jgi:DNA end-binding protein Ku|nr:Ku protein [Haloplasmataceae bacterium]
MGVSWKGSISFGLIYIPISLYVATSEESIGFNMLHKECNNRIKYKKVCEFCDQEIKSGDIVKGYNYEGDKYIVFDENDFERLKSPKDKSINITQFVDLSEIDTVFYDKAYYVVPDGGERAFELLKQAMKETNKVGIAKVVFGTKENLVAIRMSGDKLLLNTLYFVNEIRSVQMPYIKVDVGKAEVDLAKQLITNMTSHFKPEGFHDEYRERLKSAIEQKIHGEEITIPVEKPDNNIINLMEALQQSIANSNQPRV